MGAACTTCSCTFCATLKLEDFNHIGCKSALSCFKSGKSKFRGRNVGASGMPRSASGP